MNSRCEVIQKNALVGREEMRGGIKSPSSMVSIPLSDRRGAGGAGGAIGGPIVCPKPQRVVGFLANQSSAMSLRWQKRSPQTEVADSKAGAELLDLILTKGSYGTEQSSPFFCGSPPSRVSNPLVQDAQFVNGKLSPLSTLQTISSSPSTASSPSPSPSSARKSGGCVRMKFGLTPASVRIEGFESFDCHSMDRQNSGITAVA